MAILDSLRRRARDRVRREAFAAPPGPSISERPISIVYGEARFPGAPSVEGLVPAPVEGGARVVWDERAGDLVIRGIPSRSYEVRGADEESVLEDGVYRSARLYDILTVQDRIPIRDNRVPTESTYVHVSTLLRACPRAHVLTARRDRDEIMPREVRGAMQVVWRMGRAAEAHIKEQFIAHEGREKVFGLWKCKCGSTSFQDWWSEELAVTCGRCGKKPKTYNEPVFLNHDLKIVGSPDLMVRQDTSPQAPAQIIECKSMNKRDFEALVSPDIEHIKQPGEYRRLASLNGHRMARSIIVWYICKDYLPSGSPYKVFIQPDVEAEYGNLLTSMEDKARAIRDSLEDGRDLPQGVCSDPTDASAKQCSEVGPCFQS